MTRLVIALTLAGCAAPVEHRTVALPNGCYVNAVAFYEATKAAKALGAVPWSRVLVVSYPNHPTRHAYCAYQWNNRLHVYDNRSGSWPVSRDLALKVDSSALAGAIQAGTTGVFEP